MFVLIDMIDNIILNPYFTSQELPPMRVLYSGHVIQAEKRDHYTALPLVEVLVYIYEFLYKFDTDLYKFFETRTSGGTRKGSDQKLK